MQREMLVDGTEAFVVVGEIVFPGGIVWHYPAFRFDFVLTTDEICGNVLRRAVRNSW